MHVLSGGQLVASGDLSLAQAIEAEGYQNWLAREVLMVNESWQSSLLAQSANCNGLFSCSG